MHGNPTLKSRTDYDSLQACEAQGNIFRVDERMHGYYEFKIETLRILAIYKFLRELFDQNPRRPRMSGSISYGGPSTFSRSLTMTIELHEPLLAHSADSPIRLLCHANCSSPFSGLLAFYSATSSSRTKKAVSPLCKQFPNGLLTLRAF